MTLQIANRNIGWTEYEPLDKELKLSTINRFGGSMIVHPLLIANNFEETNKFNNYTFRIKKEQVASALEQTDYRKYVLLHERPFRFDALQEISEQMENDIEWWELVCFVWIDSENIFENQEEWKYLLSSKDAHLMMTSEEKEMLDSLPDKVTVYRGCVEDLNEDGISWTIDKERAEWFANRWKGFDGQGIVRTREVDKFEIIAYLDGRKEKEVILLN